MYPIIYFDALVVKVRQEGPVINKAVHLALGINIEGNNELLGLWMTQTETAKFWLSVLTELKNRGIKDIFIASIDGLTGFAEAIEAVFAQTGAVMYGAYDRELPMLRHTNTVKPSLLTSNKCTLPPLKLKPKKH